MIEWKSVKYLMITFNQKSKRIRAIDGPVLMLYQIWINPGLSRDLLESFQRNIHGCRPMPAVQWFQTTHISIFDGHQNFY
jgi:hypothetical protein